MNPDLTLAYITALTGSPDTPLKWRVINDRDRGAPASNLRGSFHTLRDTLRAWNEQGWGVFCNVNEMDGNGATLNNVRRIRAHVVDLDDPMTAPMNYDRAVNSYPQPHFAVQTSPGKFHLYWLVDPYQGNDFYAMHQRKLAQLYQGDKSIVDATRVLRVPGFLHHKHDPFLVTCWGLSGVARYSAQAIQDALLHVNIIDHSVCRFPLGTPEMQAPSLDWLWYALNMVDPNQMSYDEWMSFTAAFKQAGWTLTDEGTLYNMWSRWCESYSGNNPSENLKLWRSHKDTNLGWKSIEHRVPQIKAMIAFGHKEKPPQGSLSPAGVGDHQCSTHLTPEQAVCQPFPEIMDAYDCQRYFDGCVFIEREGKVFTKQGRFLNQTQFNGKFGGHQFIITSTGKTTDEPWKAALKSTVRTITKVDHVRFLPQHPPMAIIQDRMGRDGVNTYIPPIIDMREGDVTPFLDHMTRILPDESDRRMYFDYMAHAVKYPGVKIQYAPLLQSAEGIGKSAFLEIMSHALGDMYVYCPNAQELVSSGSKFNAWMRGKLAIMVNEIKVDERRELIEVLKPMITDARIEVQAKGVDQDMEDNMANWFFYSNFKDAIPINKNGRRYAVFYSALQYESDILAAGMDAGYFKRFWHWLRHEGGLQYITYWLKNYPIEEGSLPVRAPRTSSYAEALTLSRSPLEVIIQEGIEDGAAGFRGGFVSVQAAVNKSRNTGLKNVTARSVETVLEAMQYRKIGKTNCVVMQEDPSTRSTIYSANPHEDVDRYMAAQGYALA